MGRPRAYFSTLLQCGYTLAILLLAISSIALTQGMCVQTPPQTKDSTPTLNKGIYKLSIDTKGNDSEKIYIPDQTYVLTLKTDNDTRPFRWFMITVEDPDDDNSSYGNKPKPGHVGSLKTLDSFRQSRYSERCFNSVESVDNSDKYRIEIHWLSPKQNKEKKQTVRFRATVGENEETWYTGDFLSIELTQDDKKSLDSPPFPPNATCNLCSEARYELLFKGRWSRMSHPRHYPSKPDENGYSHMVGASHAYSYTLWQKGDKAREGLKVLAKDANISVMEREIIDAMESEKGTRTLIRGKRRHHPHMFEPSHSLFRVDRIHHLFSVVVAMKPSPDWFLGVSKFELCTDNGWLESYELPLYPWDAGVMEGISYESEPVVSQTTDVVDRVQVGSFNVESPFYQMNLIDLKPFALIEVRKLAEYRLEGMDCSTDQGEEAGNTAEGNVKSEKLSEFMEDPAVLESKMEMNNCVLSEWTEWSECVPNFGTCGNGLQQRSRFKEDDNAYFTGYKAHDLQASYAECEDGMIQTQKCYVDCSSN